MNTLSRKSAVTIYIVLVTLIPNLIAALAVDGTNGHKYDISGTIMWGMVPIAAILLFINELPRQKAVPKAKPLKSYTFTLAYTLLILFIGLAVSGTLAFFMTGPDSF
jgi:hypothetical protein